MTTLTILPFLTAFFAGLARMAPTDIYQVCAWRVGTVKTEPWRARSLGGLRQVSRRLLGAIGAAMRACLPQGRLVAAVASLALMLYALDVSVTGTLLASPILVGAPLKALRQQAADIDGELALVRQELQALNAKLIGEKRKMTDEERAQFTVAKARLTELKELKATTAELLVEAEAVNERERTAAAVDDPDAKTATKVAAAAGLQVGKDRAEDDPKKGFRDHQDFLGAVIVAGKIGRIDPRLKPLQAAQGSDEQGVYSDPHGGFLVPHGVAPGILQIEAEEDFIAPMVTDISPMAAPTVSFNARVDKDHTSSVSGGFIVTRHPETVDGSSSRMKFEQVTLTANEEFGIAYATERILTDSPQSFVAIISAAFNDEYANNAIKERLVGSGVGERLGILHATNGCLVTVAKESGQAADTIVKENIDKLAARCWRYLRSVYIANHDTRPQLRSIVQVVGTGGQPVPYFTQGADGVEYLDGRRIYFSEHAKKLGDKGDLILAVWSQYLEGTYQQLQSAESIHVRFLAAERCFRFYRRNDGQPWWRAALTPANSADTLSPFLVLAAR